MIKTLLKNYSTQSTMPSVVDSLYMLSSKRPLSINQKISSFTNISKDT